MKKMIFILMGPSGSGKTTLGNYLKSIGVPELVSHTTRPMRPGEIDGVTYHFVDTKTIRSIPMVEITDYDGKAIRGLSKQELEDKLSKHDTVFFIADINGVNQIRALYPRQTRVVFLDVSINVMSERMAARGDSPEAIATRIAWACSSGELNNGTYSDYIISSGPLDEVKERLCNIIFANREPKKAFLKKRAVTV